MDYLEQFKLVTFFGNTGYDYVVAFVIFVGLIIVLKIIKMGLVGRLRQLAKKTKTDFDDTVIDIFGKVKPPFYFFVALYFAVQYLSVPELGSKVLKVVFLIIIVWEVVNGLARLVDYFAGKSLSQMEGDDDRGGQSKAMVRAINMIVKAILWALGLTLILANLGVDVTSLIASLGIGGLAIALALQNVLRDIFSSFSIYIDKPFMIGDHIVIGSDSGTVEKIGLKTTRIRTLQGEELIVSNTELTDTRVQNFKKMERRRVVFSLGIIYETKGAKLEQIPDLVKGIITGVKGAEFDRCHFKEYGDSALIFETVFYIGSGDYSNYLDVKQKVNYAIFERFNTLGIEFAYPTQKVFISK